MRQTVAPQHGAWRIEATTPGSFAIIVAPPVTKTCQSDFTTDTIKYRYPPTSLGGGVRLWKWLVSMCIGITDLWIRTLPFVAGGSDETPMADIGDDPSMATQWYTEHTMTALLKGAHSKVTMPTSALSPNTLMVCICGLKFN